MATGYNPAGQPGYDEHGNLLAWKILADRAYAREKAQQAQKAARKAARAIGRTQDRQYKDFAPTPRKVRPGDVSPTFTPQTSRQTQSSNRREAVYAQYADTLTKYGFDRGSILKFLRGLDYTTLRNTSLVTQAFRETSMWQERFGAATRGREKAGMSYLNEGEIIALEDTYRQIYTAAGIPKRFYDQEDLNKLIINDVSPSEVAERVSLAEQAVNNTDKSYVRSFREFYGIDKKHLIGYMLNREKGVEVLRQQVEAAKIGSEARTTGMDNVGRKFAEKLVDKDISRQEARQAFATVADQEGDWKNLASMSGEKISERGLIKDELGLDKKGQVGRKKKRLASQERARFGGTGAGTGAMGSSSVGAF